MEDQNNFFELALKSADEKIAHINSEQHTLQSTLNQLLAEKTILLGTRRALLIQLGELSSPSDLAPPITSPAHKNTFKGMGLAAAARKFLTEIGQPQTHAAVVDALLKGNVKTASKRPGNSIRTSMQNHPDWFRWTKLDGDRGYWELVEWPPQGHSPGQLPEQAVEKSPEVPITAPFAIVR